MESDIDNALYKVCPAKNWPYYKFKDFEIKSACEEITKDYLPDLERLLYRRTTEDILINQRQFCGGT